MRTPKMSTKRALGLAVAAALAIGATVAVTNSADAATTQSFKLSPATGSAAGGTVVAITGKDFQNSAGVSKVGTVDFGTSSCASTPGGTAAAAKAVASTTRIVVTTPALALTANKPTKYYVCAYKVGNTALLGSAVFTSYNAPYINASGDVAPTSGANFGGGKVTISGENFTSKTTATIGGVAVKDVKVVLGSGTTASASNGDDTLTGTVPAGTGAGKSVIVTSEGGNTTATSTFDYKTAVKVSPSSGDGTAGNVITINGSGFQALTFGAATGNAVVGLVNAGIAQTGGTVTATTVIPVATVCTALQVVSDTELACTLPAISNATAAGGYQAVVFIRGATAAQAAAGTSYFSVGGAYTVAAF